MATKNFVNTLVNNLNAAGGQLAGIYLIYEVQADKPYVGKAREITKRILQHINNRKASSGIDKRLADLGPEAFEFKILDLLPEASDELLFFKEQEWIEKLNAKTNGYNLTSGNWKHSNKWLESIAKYVDSYTVSTDMIKLIASRDVRFFNHRHYTMIHEYDKAVKERIKFEDNTPITQIHNLFSKTNAKGKLEEDTAALADYIMKELDEMQSTNRSDLGEVIANVPYGPVGAEIMTRIISDFTFEDCYSLEPGNDYFTKSKLYKHIDPSFKPIICRNGCFKNASQTTVITKLQKAQNNLSELEARILLHIDTAGNDELYMAITEYLLKINTLGTLKFSQRSDISYSADMFVFNPGAYDIHHGYFAVYDSKKKAWTSSTDYNIFKVSTIGHKNSPSSKVVGCTSFKKLIYSKLGLQFLRVLFTASPEGWGFLNGFFADIDYSGITSIIDFFNKIGLTAASQSAFLKAMSEITLTKEELDIVTFAEEL